MKTHQSKFCFISRIFSFLLIFVVAISCSRDSDDPAPITIGGNVTTLAGSTDGFNDGTGSDAQFNYPTGVRFDNHGDLIVADYSNHKIRKVTLDGLVTTIAGSTQGFWDDAGSLAKFNRPESVCVDASGNIFVADSFNHKIRKINPAGYVSTYAGSDYGFYDGIGTSAKFYSPSAMCFDSADNMYVADSANHRIRKITPTGEVTTFAGGSEGFSDGIGSTAKFYYPSGICIDANDNLYVADYINNKIRKVTPSGEVSTIAGSSFGFYDGISSAAKFRNPAGITIDPQGNLYVADSDNNKIRKVTSTGVVTTIAGNLGGGYRDGNGQIAKFSNPRDIVYHKGKLYVADSGNDRIRVIQ